MKPKIVFKAIIDYSLKTKMLSFFKKIIKTILVITDDCYTFAPRQATSSCRTSPGWKHSKDKAVERCAWRFFSNIFVSLSFKLSSFCKYFSEFDLIENKTIFQASEKKFLNWVIIDFYWI